MSARNKGYGLPMMALAACMIMPGWALAAANVPSWLPPAEQAEAALNAQPGVHAAVAQLQAAAATERALIAGSHELEVTTGLQHRNASDEMRRYNEWEVQISRPIRLPDKARLDREIGGSTLTHARMQWEDAGHQTARRLLQVWTAWLRSALVADELQAQNALLARESAVMKRRVAVGDAARRDSDVLQAERAMLAAQVRAASDAAHAARQALAIEFPQIVPPAQRPALPDPEPLAQTEQNWRARIIEQSAEIGMADQEAARLAKVAQRARADRTPDPTVGMRVASERGGRDKIVGIFLSVPFGSDYRSAIASTESSNAAAARARAAGVRRAVEQNAWVVVQAANSRRMQWQSYVQALAAQTTASARTRRAWELGEAPLAEHLLALRNLHQARLAEAQARLDALEAAALVRIDAHELWHLPE